LEPEEEPAEAAAREVLEEAGVRGQLGACLGVFEVATNLNLFLSLILIYYFF